MAAIILVAINSVPIFAASSRVFANHIMAETIQDQVQTAIVDIMTTAEVAAIAIAIVTATLVVGGVARVVLGGKAEDQIQYTSMSDSL